VKDKKLDVGWFGTARRSHCIARRKTEKTKQHNAQNKSKGFKGRCDVNARPAENWGVTPPINYSLGRKGDQRGGGVGLVGWMALKGGRISGSEASTYLLSSTHLKQCPGLGVRAGAVDRNGDYLRAGAFGGGPRTKGQRPVRGLRESSGMNRREVPAGEGAQVT